MSSLLVDLGRRIAALRSERRLERRDLSARIGLSPSGLGYLERGTTSTRTEIVERLAAALGVDAADLFTFPWRRYPRHHARELVRHTPDDKLDGLIAVMEAYLAAELPLVGLITRKRPR